MKTVTVVTAAASAQDEYKKCRQKLLLLLLCMTHIPGLDYRILHMQLEELNITGEQSNDNWHVGLDCIPDEWAGMTRLTKLELRGHSLLNVSQLPSKSSKTLRCRMICPCTLHCTEHATPCSM